MTIKPMKEGTTPPLPPVSFAQRTSLSAFNSFFTSSSILSNVSAFLFALSCFCCRRAATSFLACVMFFLNSSISALIVALFTDARHSFSFSTYNKSNYEVKLMREIPISCQISVESFLHSPFPSECSAHHPVLFSKRR